MSKKQDPTISIKILMLKKGINLKTLMKRFKMTHGAISNAINGRRPKLQAKIIKYLKGL